MAINFSLREFYDSTTELVGIKSGLLLNRFQAAQILRENHDDTFLKSDDLEMYMRIHSSEVENILLTIRQRIGNLPLELPSSSAYRYLKEYGLRTKDIDTVSKANSIGFRYLHSNRDIDIHELAHLICTSEEFSKDLSMAIATIVLENDDLSCVMPSNRSWNEATELSDLYNCELKSENNFLEQKFTDYLAVNGHEIETIHWRNFERFCAEYFKKQGYKVVLGPGTNDGGVDIRAYKEDGSAPEFLIQCKRYAGDNKVNIETVKSFYTDVQYENARHGLIATTSYIASGGKKVCETRGWNIKFAEKDNVKKWATEMWTYK